LLLLLMVVEHLVLRLLVVPMHLHLLLLYVLLLPSVRW
jgi:hypothetical protein